MWKEKISETARRLTDELWDVQPGDSATATVALWSEPAKKIALLGRAGLPGLVLPTVEDIPVLATFDRAYAAEYLCHILDPLLRELRMPQSQIDSIEGLLAPASARVGHHRLIAKPLPHTGGQVVFPYRVVLRGRPQIPGASWRALPEARHDLDSSAHAQPRQAEINHRILRRVLDADLEAAAHQGGLQTNEPPSYSQVQQRGYTND